MKKLICFFSAVALIFTSCSSEDSSTSSSNVILLARTIETFDDGSTLTTNYSFNGNKLIGYNDSDDDGATFVYNANGKLISGTESFYDYMIDDIRTVDVTYTYDAQDRLTSEETSDGLRSDYIYNTDGTITENIYSSSGSLSSSYINTFQNGNLTSEVGTGISSGISSVYQHDAFNSPFKNVHAPYDGFRVLFAFDLNNTTSFVVNNDSSNVASSTTTYTYNSSNFPISSIETFGDGSTTTTQYFYN